MSLSLGQQRALDGIEQSLRAEDPPLRSLFEVFNRLAQNDAMPGTEHVPAEVRMKVRKKLLRPLVVIPIALIFLLGVVLLGRAIPIGRGCGVSTAAARTSQLASRPGCFRRGPGHDPAKRPAGQAAR